MAHDLEGELQAANAAKDWPQAAELTARLATPQCFEAKDHEQGKRHLSV